MADWSSCVWRHYDLTNLLNKFGPWNWPDEHICWKKINPGDARKITDLGKKYRRGMSECDQFIWRFDPNLSQHLAKIFIANEATTDDASKPCNICQYRHKGTQGDLTCTYSQQNIVTVASYYTMHYGCSQLTKRIWVRRLDRSSDMGGHGLAQRGERQQSS